MGHEHFHCDAIARSAKRCVWVVFGLAIAHPFLAFKPQKSSNKTFFRNLKRERARYLLNTCCVKKLGKSVKVEKSYAVVSLWKFPLSLVPRPSSLVPRPSSNVRIENYFFNYWTNSAEIWHTCVNPKVSAAQEVWWCHVSFGAWRGRQ